MDWVKIKKKCVKGYKKFSSKYFGSLNIGIKNKDLNKYMNSFKSNNRDLFNFFDDNKIFIQINPEYYISRKISFWYNIFYLAGEIHVSQKAYKDRIEAENEAFEKAFYFLEDTL